MSAKKKKSLPLRKSKFQSISFIEQPDFLKNLKIKDTSLPGNFPFTRGIHKTGYRGRLWTFRQFAGFGSAEDTNKRFKYLLAQGQTGLSTAFDMPTLMGYDPDHEMSRGEIGREGVSVATIADMDNLFKGISLDQVSVSMTINCTAPIALAFYFALAKKRKIKLNNLRGTIQNDILKEFIAQKEWIIPPQPAVRLNCDVIEYCSKHAVKFNPVSISGYHIREAGATAVQELSFTLADGLAYVEHCVSRGMNIDQFAPRLSFFFDVHNDFFEEVAKLRAARRLWAKLIKERYSPKNPDSMKLRMHAQTAGVSLTAQQPLNNVARVALQAMAAVLGGVQSLHTNALDETLSLPTEQAALVALRTQQIIAEESGVVNTIDPLGGSYYIEDLTNKIEAQALKYINKIDSLGGMLNAVELGYPQKEISESAYRFQKAIDQREFTIVGVNKFTTAEEQKIPTLKINHKLENNRIKEIKSFKKQRSLQAVNKASKKLISCCEQNRNIMPVLIEAALVGLTLGEASDIFRDVFGTYRDPGHV